MDGTPIIVHQITFKLSLKSYSRLCTSFLSNNNEFLSTELLFRKRF